MASDESEPREARRSAEAELRALARARRGRVVRAVVVGVLVVLLIVFVAQNARSVEVRFLGFQGNPLLVWVMLACAAAGGVVGFLVGRPARRRRRDAGAPPQG